MADSNRIDTAAQMSCTYDGAAYYLPRTLVTVVVDEATGAEKDRGSTPFVLEKITAQAKQDRKHAYCLDFLKSPTSEDTFVVSRDEDLLLTRVTSESNDKTKEIAKSIIQAIFTGITGAPNFSAGGAAAKRSGLPRPVLGYSKRRELEYDPFDEDQADVINDALKDFGYCLVLEDARFMALHVSPQEYCDRPLGHKRREAMLLRATSDKFSDAPPPLAEGVFYRPRLPYNFHVLEKKNLQAHGGWTLLGSSSVLFENGSPVFSVAVNRTYFADRKTTLEFAQGALMDVTIDKGSELLGFVELPLTVAQAVTAIPTAILQVKIDATNNRAQLIEAQSKLLTAHQQYIASLNTFKQINEKSPIKTANIVADGGLPFDDNRSMDPETAKSLPQPQTITFDQCKKSYCGADAYCDPYCQCFEQAACLPEDVSSCTAACDGLQAQKN